MDENNLLNDDFTPDGNDPYNETDSKKKKNTIMYVGAGIALVLLLFLIFGTQSPQSFFLTTKCF